MIRFRDLPAAVRGVATALALFALAPLLGACDEHSSPAGSLPTVPADIQTCFRKSATDVPQRTLSAADVESLWKVDRVRLVVEQRCGKRLLSWYADLQKNWR